MLYLPARSASSSCCLTPQQVAEVVAQTCPTEDYRGKRVLLIDWSGSVVTASADELFPSATSTKFDRTIHAWDYDAARGYTPSEGTNIALAKVLGPLGYPREIVDALKGGGMAGPQLFNPQVLERLQARNPSVFRLVMAAIKARVGSAGLEDYAAESERYRMGAGNATGGILR
mgnify:CR=1 FL=1